MTPSQTVPQSQKKDPSSPKKPRKSTAMGLPELLAKSPVTEENALRSLLLLSMALDNEIGFGAFYELIFGKQLPKHAEEWVKGIYAARAAGKGIAIQAFRGSTKTTTLTVGFTAWRIGKEPHRANLLVQVGDDIALDNVAQIAGIIEYNPWWKRIFPNVVPDKELGWGASGYQVKRNDVNYDVWRQWNSKRKDPTLVGVGYKSSEIIGKHPDGVLVIDDIHNEGNTSSERELATVRRILTGTIFPTATPDTWRVMVGTPWVENDVYSYAASTGEFIELRTPVMKEDGELAWPDKYNQRELEKQMNLAGSIEYARMFMLDLTKSKNRIFRYMKYPNEEIKSIWPMVGGVDYAGSMDEFKNKSGKGDFFAMAYVAKLPGGGAVVVDGVLDRGTQADSEVFIKQAQNIWPGWLYAVVEGDGRGEDFIQVLRRNPGLKIVPMKTGGKGKNDRLVKQMSPWLENGTVRISDAETPFLNELRKELDMYPLAAHDDALDALYWAMRGIPDVMNVPMDDGIPATVKRKKFNPFAEIGRY